MKILGKIFLSSLIVVGAYTIATPTITAKAYTMIDDAIHPSRIKIDSCEFTDFSECEVRTHGGPLNVRKGPGLNYPCIGRVRYHERVERLYMDEDWDLVRYRVDGKQDTYKIGWVYHEYIYLLDARGNKA